MIVELSLRCHQIVGELVKGGSHGMKVVRCSSREIETELAVLKRESLNY